MEPQPSETSREAKALWQGFLFRPWTGQSPYSMPSVGLYLVGAATSRPAQDSMARTAGTWRRTSSRGALAPTDSGHGSHARCASDGQLPCSGSSLSRMGTIRRAPRVIWIPQPMASVARMLRVRVRTSLQ